MELKVTPEKIIFHPEKVEQAMHRKAVYALRSSAKYLHTTVKNSIRISKYPSKPGSQPHTRPKTRRLKYSFRSHVDETKLVATIGIASSLGNEKYISNVASIHEFGGRASSEYPPRKVGDWGPIRLADGMGWLSPKKRTAYNAIYNQFRIIKLRTTAQAATANRMLENFFGKPLKYTTTYPKRPYLAPALKAAWPRIMEKFGIH